MYITFQGAIIKNPLARCPQNNRSGDLSPRRPGCLRRGESVACARAIKIRTRGLSAPLADHSGLRPSVAGLRPSARCKAPPPGGRVAPRQRPTAEVIWWCPPRGSAHHASHRPALCQLPQKTRSTFGPQALPRHLRAALGPGRVPVVRGLARSAAAALAALFPRPPWAAPVRGSLRSSLPGFAPREARTSPKKQRQRMRFHASDEQLSGLSLRQGSPRTSLTSARTSLPSAGHH